MFKTKRRLPYRRQAVATVDTHVAVPTGLGVTHQVSHSSSSPACSPSIVNLIPANETACSVDGSLTTRQIKGQAVPVSQRGSHQDRKGFNTHKMWVSATAAASNIARVIAAFNARGFW